MKTCFKCGATKLLSDFYKHPMMAGGRVNKCKECNKADVRENRSCRIAYYRAYDRNRANILKRKLARAAYAETSAGRDAQNRGIRAYKIRHPLKRSAHIIAGNAIRDGRILKQPCVICGEEKAQAHHDDYSKPLDVRWLCSEHHNEYHNVIRELARNQ